MAIGLAGADLRLLRLFMTIARRGGFAAAQADLNISPSTISNHVKALEERLGVTLCRRGRGGFALTGDGAKIFQAAERLFAAIASFETELAVIRGKPGGEIHLGLGDGLRFSADGPVQRALRQFTEMKPGLRVSLHHDTVMELQNQVRDGRLTGALLGFPKDLPLLRQRELRMDELEEERMLLCCGRGHSLFEARWGEPSASDVRSQAVIVRDNWPEAFVRKLQPSGIRGHAQSAEGVLALVLSGGYLGYLPEGFVAPWIASGEVRALEIPELARSVLLCLLTREAGNDPDAVAALRSAVRAVARPGTHASAARPRTAGHGRSTATRKA